MAGRCGPWPGLQGPIKNRVRLKKRPFFFILVGLQKAGLGLADSRFWVLSSVGRAAPLQGVGREFDPLSTHQNFFAVFDFKEW